jgi:DNA-binding transcriptional MerR regulator/methylmalonyl-CoA mutase cobalamin-binding subunit
MLARESHVQPPALDSYSDMPLFNTKAVVRQTGVPAPTLRAWERRYGILAPRRGENDYRLYSERDMAVVAWLRERVESGLTISQAIALLRSLEPGRKRRRARAQSAPITHEPPESVYPPLEAGAALLPGATEPARFSLNELSDALIRHFRNLDEAAACRVITQAFAVHAIEDVCLRLFTPALTRIGQLWRDGETPVTVEHFASAIVRGQLESLFRAQPASFSGPLAFAGCAPGEQHELGALMLALFLRRAGLRVAFLGQNVELEGLISAVRAARPASVLLSATLRPQAEALEEVGRRLDALGAGKPAFFFGGQAFTSEPALASRISGVLLDMDASQAAHEVKRRLQA